MTRIACGENAPATERGRRFRRSGNRTLPGVADRQARATLLAFQTFPDRAAAMAFMHDVEPTLAGRPLDVAGESEEGFERVMTAIRDAGGVNTGS